MKTVIVGCGRVGAVVAEAFDRAGHEVIIIDRSTSAFDKLDDTFKGTAIRGDGTDEDVLRRAGAEDADLFLALTEGDNRNTMSAQIATEALGARKVVAKINDPLRAEAYADLGIATICRTDLMLDAILAFVGMPVTPRTGVQAAKGQHLGGEHHGMHDAVDTSGEAGTTGGTELAAAGAVSGSGAGAAILGSNADRPKEA
ncbi:MAG TPA: TrkA family potassium uptake protein [Candidatus Acidoferrum sp.]|jgi:trk system potassium uptake protein TrkA|nr:TrkA family potassium uptake protein [Candidatus Acidoferrum sp.]